MSDVERMLADLGNARRDIVSAPKDNRGRDLSEREAREIRQQAEARQARIRDNAPANNPLAAATVAWNTPENFGGDEVAEHLENRYHGQGHRLQLQQQLHGGQGHHNTPAPSHNPHPTQRPSPQVLGAQAGGRGRHYTLDSRPPPNTAARGPRASSPRSHGTVRFTPQSGRNAAARPPPANPQAQAALSGWNSFTSALSGPTVSASAVQGMSSRPTPTPPSAAPVQSSVQPRVPTATSPTTTPSSTTPPTTIAPATARTAAANQTAPAPPRVRRVPPTAPAPVPAAAPSPVVLDSTLPATQPTLSTTTRTASSPLSASPITSPAQPAPSTTSGPSNSVGDQTRATISYMRCMHRIMASNADVAQFQQDYPELWEKFRRLRTQVVAKVVKLAKDPDGNEAVEYIKSNPKFAPLLAAAVQVRAGQEVDETIVAVQEVVELTAAELLKERDAEPADEDEVKSERRDSVISNAFAVDAHTSAADTPETLQDTAATSPASGSTAPTTAISAAVSYLSRGFFTANFYTVDGTLLRNERYGVNANVHVNINIVARDSAFNPLGLASEMARLARDMDVMSANASNGNVTPAVAPAVEEESDEEL